MTHETANDSYCDRIEYELDRRLSVSGYEPASLRKAMRYAVLGHGKRIRPRLVYAAGAVLDIPIARLAAPACAVEIIHAYSLIHDDLPAMDDDDLRRGKPTTHIAFGEATAILAGDALQALAFELLATDISIGDDPESRARLMATLAHACGPNGMVGGQALDIANEGRTISITELEQIHHKKTGQLLRACVVMPADYHADLRVEQREALADFGTNIGLAFQVRDDILDVEGTTERLGKTQGSDAALHKATYPALLGMDNAKDLVEHLYQTALDALTPFGQRAEPLRNLARLMVKRDY